MLASLDQQTDRPYHLLLNDDGSIDGTQDFLRQYRPTNNNCLSLDIYFGEKQQGVHWARNKLLKLAARYNDAFLATVDNDVLLPSGWLGQCIDFLLNNPYWMCGVNYEGVRYPLQEMNGHHYQVKHAGNLGTATEVFSRELVQQLGYFDYDFGEIYGEEDPLWAWRARQLKPSYQMVYLETDGVHIGTGSNDPADYREWKTAAHSANLEIFRSLCRQYGSTKKPLFVSFDWQPDATKLFHWEPNK